jgi:dihydroorotase
VARSITLAIVGFELVIRNGTLVSGGGRRRADIGISAGRVAAVGEHLETAAEEIDAAGLHVLPGVIDEHVHFREPGLEHEETWLTGTRAAVFGGVTTVLDMPNTIPPTDSHDRAIDKQRLAAASAYCDFGLFGLAGMGWDRTLLGPAGVVVGLKAFLGPTTGGLTTPDKRDLRRILRVARESGTRVAFHAEDRAIIAHQETSLRRAGRFDALAHLEARPARAEVAAIDSAAALLLEVGASGHILHLSSVDGLLAVEAWRARGVDLTCETTPHHLLLDRSAYAADGLAKVNPPFRGDGHSRALLRAAADGRIDCVGSDHAPHRLADKQRDSIWDVPSGFAGVETLLPLLLSEVAVEHLSLERVVALTAESPARTWGLWPRKASMQIGSDADLTLVDLQREGSIAADRLHGMNDFSPWEGRRTIGAVEATIVRGHVVMRAGRLTGDPGWGQPIPQAIHSLQG